MKHLQYAMYCYKSFTYTDTFNSHNNLQGVFYYPNYTDERLNNLPKSKCILSGSQNVT